MADREGLLDQFCRLTGAPRDRGRFFLEASSWKLQAAMDSFYDNSEGEDATTPQQQATDWPPSSSKHFASMSEYQQQKRAQQEDRDSQNFFAGGSERSGQLISGPPREKKGPKDMAQAVFDAAKQHGAKSVEEEEEEERKAKKAAFGGQGFKLGQTSGANPRIGKREDPVPEPQVRIAIKFWSNGFSVDDGPLRDGSTPEDQEFVDAVSKGEIPSELRRLAKKGEVNVDIEDHRREEYRFTPPKVKAFSGEGHKLGNVTGSVTTSDLFDDVVRDMFSIADAQQKGHLTREEFESFLHLEHFSGCLDQPDYSQSLQYFDSSATDGQLAYDMFAPVARELILRVYQVRDTSGSDWVQLSTAQGVNFWLNKFNGETRIVDEAPLAERQEEIDFMNQVYSQLDATQTELEQEKTRNKEITNQSYHLQEELEKAHEALYTTGQTLDDTSAELETKSSEIAKLKEVLEAKETDSQKMQERIAELEQLAEALQSTKRELNDAKSLVSRQEGRLMEKDAALTQLQNKCDNTVEQLKSATGVIDARDSSVRNLTKALDGEKKRVEEFEHHVPQVEERMRNAEEELTATKQQLEEKIRALQTTRKQLKSTRDRNMELEKDIEKLLVVKEKCIDAEGEIRTLKSFLVSKTSIVEKKKNEVKELQAQMMEMEKKDEKRAIILASVLEKTARMQQSASEQHVPSHGMPLHRSTSAPSLLPDSGEDVAQLRVAQSKRKAHTTSKAAKPWTTGPPPPHTSRTGKARKKGKKVQTLPRLPPVMSSHLDKKEFSFPTLADIKHSQKLQDAVVVEHSSSNPTCRCAMCMLHESAIASVAEAGLQTAATVTGLSGLGSLAKQHGDEMEMQLSKKLHLGDRVIVQLKRTMYDLEPRKLSGTVKYVGKVDREYVDNRVYVGVRLDDPVGDSDGLFKGKRYFMCTPKHGKMVRINNVIAVLYPKMGTAYQPLVCPQQKTPYNLGSLAGDTMLQLPVN